MSSRGKKKTTMAKLNREARLRERRLEKQTRKEARRVAAASSTGFDQWAPPDGDHTVSSTVTVDEEHATVAREQAQGESGAREGRRR